MPESLLKQTPSQDQAPVSYASPGFASRGVWAAALVSLVGIVLIGLGGCFLIGVMMMLTDSFFWGLKPLVWTPASYALIAILFAAALACFAGASITLARGVRALLRHIP